MPEFFLNIVYFYLNCPPIFKLAERYGTSEIDGDDMTYSMYIEKKTSPLPKITWTLGIIPFSDRTRTPALVLQLESRVENY